jgi:4-amino-4-deoxy-L-arabinose transferase-like glycosyltransferase
MPALAPDPPHRASPAVAAGGEAGPPRLAGTLAGATVWTRVALVAIVGLAVALRLVALGRVPPDPFYDAAVRTMGGSWHAFLVGALEPGTRVSIDKPPVALWPQVASTQLFGFGRIQLQAPIVLAGIGAVLLLYDLVRRVAGRGAGLAAALVLATLPIAVLTDRSDTMDGVMTALLVLTAWLIVYAAQSGRAWLLWAAGAAAGLAFEVKLFESLVAAPALAVLALVAWRGPRRHLLGMAAAFVVVALAWLATISLLPASERPFALGSSNGSAWNAAFAYNGLGRVSGLPATLDPQIGTHLTTPGPVRLLGSRTPELGALVGTTVLAAVLLGVLALAGTGWRALRRDRTAGAAALALALWLLCGLVVFSAMQHLHARYLAELAPAAAAGVGVGVVALARASSRRRWLAFACTGASAAAGVFAATLVHRGDALRVVVLLALVGLALVLALGVALRRVAWPLLAAVSLAVVIAIPAAHSVDVVRTAQNDAGQAGQIAAPVLQRLSAYLIGNQGSASDEVAVESPYTAAAIVVHDGRPVLVLDNESDRPLVSVATLRAAVRRGQVRYALLGPRCLRSQNRRQPGCRDSRWVRAHGVDVSAAAGLWPGPSHMALYRLSARNPGRAAASRPRSGPRAARAHQGARARAGSPP